MLNKRFAGIILVLSILLSLVFGVIFIKHRLFLQHAKGLGLAGIFLINFLASASFSVAAPGSLIAVAEGSIYSAYLVALFASFGAALGDLIILVVGFSGRELAFQKFEKTKWFTSFEKIFREYSGWILFVFGFIPNPLFDIVGLTAGIFAYSPVKYFLIVFVARFIRFLLI
jgi:membrane protein YqaA with SNARE-associated domain